MTGRPWQTGVSHAERWAGYYLPGFDPTDPSSQVMRNNLGITDQARLDEAESRYVTANMAFYLSSPHPGDDFGLARLQGIHHALFSDVYPWAGEIRTVGMSKTGSKPFLAPTDITQTMAHLEDTLTNTNLLRNVTPERYPEAIGRVYSAINQVHAFREGNGRSQRIWLSELATRSGHFIDWQGAYREQNDLACIVAADGDYTLMTQMMTAITSRSAQQQLDPATMQLNRGPWPLPTPRDREVRPPTAPAPIQPGQPPGRGLER